ncbi:uncharacterized protein METZ01_LOCUS360136 [marine metagenome]|uniref:Uncharacterized protein n=1 Tax=marine metagenome TaxID=408172 RepID=A0A382SCK2_9ZZZZ
MPSAFSIVGRDLRQVGIVDAEGNPAALTGESCMD